MIGVSAFIEKVREIAARDPKYRTGGAGKDGTCDCIGLIMGAMYELGRKKYDLHSTNYFARYQTLELRDVTERDMHPGMILYRTREDTGKLAARYQKGGAHYTGDLLDYYHVLVVTSTRPLEIIECTEYGSVSGIVISNATKGKYCGGKLRGVLYEDYVEEAGRMYEATVATEKDPLRVREWPKTGAILGSVPKGKTVEVLEDETDGWAKIRYNELEGYVSAQYLERTETNETEPEQSETVLMRDDGVRIRLDGIWRIAGDD